MSVKELIPVKGNTTLGRDPHSRAIVNTDMKGLAEAKARHAALNKRKEKQLSNERRIDELEQNVSEIHGMLKEILKRLS